MICKKGELLKKKYYQWDSDFWIWMKKLWKKKQTSFCTCLWGQNAWNSVSSVQKVLLFNAVITNVQVSHFESDNWEIILQATFTWKCQMSWRLFLLKCLMTLEFASLLMLDYLAIAFYDCFSWLLSIQIKKY